MAPVDYVGVMQRFILIRPIFVVTILSCSAVRETAITRVIIKLDVDVESEHVVIGRASPAQKRIIEMSLIRIPGRRISAQFAYVAP